MFNLLLFKRVYYKNVTKFVYPTFIAFLTVFNYQGH